MTVLIPIFWIVFFVVIIHTILQHLLNWGIRKAIVDSDALFAFIIGFILETLLLLAILSSLLR